MAHKFRDGPLAAACVGLHVSKSARKCAPGHCPRYGGCSMTAALILAFSSVALFQFFMSYCRSVIAAYGALPLSEQVREVTGVQGREISSGEFDRLLQLTSLCPESGDDHRAIAAIRTYFRMLTFARGALGMVITQIVSWPE